MIRLFLDTNVILDLIISDRDGHQSALALENFANTHPCKLTCAWHSLSIIEYIGRKRFGSEAIHLFLRNLLDTFTVPSAGTDEAKQAFNYLAGDFEDALQISAALASEADHILTNDASGFTKSPISVLSPKDFLSMLVGKE